MSKLTVHAEGFDFELPNKDEGTQRLRFVCREPSPIAPAAQVGGKTKTPDLVTAVDGVEAPAVIVALINHLQTVGNRVPSTHTLFAIYDLERALFNLQQREDDRIARGVEGKPLP